LQVGFTAFKPKLSQINQKVRTSGKTGKRLP